MIRNFLITNVLRDHAHLMLQECRHQIIHYLEGFHLTLATVLS